MVGFVTNLPLKDFYTYLLHTLPQWVPLPSNERADNTT